ncbi:MAG: endolytic transglycosylase MltG [Alphaproteobacteria bacterium]|nr:endolytic transglycosylase MltG [Alphaproteobacteria bacterium]
MIKILYHYRLYAIAVSGACLLLLLSLLFWAISVHSILKQDADVIIDVGSSGIKIANHLQNNNVIANRHLFRIALMLSDGQLQAGEYRLNAGNSIWQIIQKMRDGEVLLRQFTLVEGHTVKRALQLLNDNQYLTGKITLTPQEGSLLPQTYLYHRGLPRNQMIRVMAKAMDEKLDELWQQRDPKITLKNQQEVIILASLVERETGIASERKHIAAVFYNRLRNDWPLQTDPTLIYWESDRLGFMNRPIRRSDLRRRHKFNTYLYRGLPPTAIANPGEEAIRAVLNPITTKDYFFVADGTGGHAFAETLAGHNRNVTKWRAIEAKQKKEGRKK